MERGVEVNDVPATVLDDEESVQQPERRGGHGEQIHGGDIRLYGCARKPSIASAGRAPRDAAAGIATP